MATETFCRPMVDKNLHKLPRMIIFALLLHQLPLATKRTPKAARMVEW